MATIRNSLAGAVLGLSALAMPALAADVKVALVPGGPHPYFANWEQGAKDAAKDFGIAHVEYKVPAKWELGLQNQLIENLTAQSFNAFLIFPGDPVATNSPMADLQSAGIPSIATAGCTKDPTPALFCFGTDVGRSAYLGTKELLKDMGNKGTIVHFTGNLVDPNTELRMKAIQQAVDESGGKVKLLQTIADIDRTPQEADEKINALLAARGKEIDGIITTAWLPSVSAATALRRIGDKRIKMVGIDHDPVVLVGDQGRLRARHDAAEPVRPSLYRQLRDGGSRRPRLQGQRQGAVQNQRLHHPLHRQRNRFPGCRGRGPVLERDEGGDGGPDEVVQGDVSGLLVARCCVSRAGYLGTFRMDCSLHPSR